MTSAEAVTAHLQHLHSRNLSPAYVDQRRRALKNLGLTTDRAVLELTAEQLALWQVQHLNGRTTGRSRNALLSHIREFYRWAHQQELTEDDRGRRLIRAKTARLLPRPIGEMSLQTAIDCAPPRIRPMLVLAAYQGLRACEIAALRREDVRDYDTPPTLVVLGKGRKERVLPLVARVHLELLTHGMPNRGAIFRMYDARGNATSRPITPARVSAACNLYLQEVGAGATLHQCRHRFGSQALRHAGGDLRLVQELMGHASPATTAIYTQWQTDRAAGVLEALSAETHQGDRVNRIPSPAPTVGAS